MLEFSKMSFNSFSRKKYGSQLNIWLSTYYVQCTVVDILRHASCRENLVSILEEFIVCYSQLSFYFFFQDLKKYNFIGHTYKVL